MVIYMVAYRFITLTWLLSPAAAFLASESASSLPATSSCPDIHASPRGGYNLVRHVVDTTQDVLGRSSLDITYRLYDGLIV